MRAVTAQEKVDAAWVGAIDRLAVVLVLGICDLLLDLNPGTYIGVVLTIVGRLIFEARRAHRG